MNKIKRIFENRRKIFIAYIVCGDPDIKTTLALMRVLAESGVDIIAVSYTHLTLPTKRIV